MHQREVRQCYEYQEKDKRPVWDAQTQQRPGFLQTVSFAFE
jgi:hypothetical protein